MRIIRDKEWIGPLSQCLVYGAPQEMLAVIILTLTMLLLCFRHCVTCEFYLYFKVDVTEAERGKVICSRSGIQSEVQKNRDLDPWHLIYRGNVGRVRPNLLPQPGFHSPSLIRMWLISSAPSNSFHTRTFNCLWQRRMELGESFLGREDSSSWVMFSKLRG